jgi:hypothetical protein
MDSATAIPQASYTTKLLYSRQDEILSEDRTPLCSCLDLLFLALTHVAFKSLFLIVEPFVPGDELVFTLFNGRLTAS